MAVVTRYFSTSSAGAGDGTTWADRAAFVSGGAINTIISAFDFTSDTLIARIGSGTYILTTAIQTFTGTAAPSATFPCLLEAANSDGTRWEPPDPNWSSAQPEWSDTGMPVLETTTNISTVNNANVGLYGLKLTASGRTGGAVVQSAFTVNWCQLINSASNANVVVITGGLQVFSNSFCKCTGTSYNSVCSVTISVTPIENVRLHGNISASGGDRRGWGISSNGGFAVRRITVFGNAGGGLVNASTGVQARPVCFECTVADNQGNGIDYAGTSSTLGVIESCMITGAHTNGINISGTNKAIIINCRIRDFTSAAITGNLDWSDPPLNGNTSASGTDADEYVDQASGDYRIKYGSDYWGLGIGAGDEPAPAGGGGALHLGGLGQTGIGAF